MYKVGIEHLKEPYRNLIDSTLKRLIEVFGEKLVSLVIYGSVARGDFRKGSDVDMLVIIEELPKSRLERSRLFVERVEKNLDPLLDKLYEEGYYITLTPIIKTVEEAKHISPIYLDMVEDAVIVYDRGEFFRKVLDKLSDKLKELNAERVYVGKKWYWRLKKDFEFGEVIVVE